MGGGAKSKSESHSGSGQLWATPFAKEAVGNVNSVFQANQPGLNQLTQIAQKQVVPALLDKFNASNAVAGQGRDYTSDVLSGKFMGGNPYIQSLLQQTRGDVTNAVNSNFEMNGRYGSDAHGGALTRELANAENGLLYQNYGDEMNRRDAAAQQALGANVADTGLLQSMLGLGAEIPYSGSNSLANALGALFSGGNEKSTQKGQSPIWGAIGAGLGAAGSIFQGAGASDRRVKKDIAKVGEFADGLGIYEFNYRDGLGLPKNRMRGVMADEVAKLRPWAYIPDFMDGFAGVDYAAL